MQNKKKVLTNLLKIAVSLLFLYWVYTQISWQQIGHTLAHTKWYFVAASLLFFIASQVLSASRLQLFFKVRKLQIGYRQNWRLYLIGMFYNLFIPGGIGGDGYKIYFLHKKKKWPLKTTTSAILLDRLSGLIAILVWMMFLALWLPEIPTWIKWAIPFALIIGISLAQLIINNYWTNFKSVFFPALGASMVVQLMQLLCVYMIMLSLGISSNQLVYLLMFLFSSILSLISFAGIGVREFVFLQAAKFYHFNPEVSVSISLIFSFLTIIVSFAGIYFHWFDKKLKEIDEVEGVELI